LNTDERIARFKELVKEHMHGEQAWGFLLDEIPADEFQPRYVTEQDQGSGRWYEYILEVFEIDQGIFVGTTYSRGLTESQENMYEDDDVYLLEEYQVTTTEWRTTKRL
jgi:hypothetical protein